ncbi:MAG: carboxypeptidase-like regulatory domain-containing protein [Planctomycetaceae bacterium]|jgi:hypothetical protein|nr:carboxypeptidase-like regulatory domain-containing protein [Planctomycetaceae bacterium]
MKNSFKLFHFFHSLFIFFVLILLTGCGSGLRFGGVVRFEDGTPVQGASVSFIDTKNQYDGQTDAQGKYTLTGATPKDGIPPGHYNVAVSMPADDNGKSVLPEKYASPDTSGLTCDVQSGSTFDIIIEKN